MSHATTPRELPLIKKRSQGEWEGFVRELEATPTGLDSDLFAYWVSQGHGKLNQTEVEIIAKVALFLEDTAHLRGGPQLGTRFLILGALTFATATTNDIRKDKGEGERPFDV
jgi:hypothetical protein